MKFLISLFFLASLVAQNVAIVPRPRQTGFRPDIRVETTQVLVPVTVTNVANQPILKLPASAFQLLSDEKPVQISSFFGEDALVSMAVLFDLSGSMKSRLHQSKEAIKQVFSNAMRGDEYALVTFSDRPHLEVRLTSDGGEIESALSGIQAKGWTSVHDAIVMGVPELKPAHNRKIMLILSDGQDNNSRYNSKEVLSLIRESDVTVYSVCVGVGNKFLQRLADETGGRQMVARHMRELPEVVLRMNEIMRHQYVLGFNAPGPLDGKHHTIGVRVTLPDGSGRVSVSCRRSYLSPE